MLPASSGDTAYNAQWSCGSGWACRGHIRYCQQGTRATRLETAKPTFKVTLAKPAKRSGCA